MGGHPGKAGTVSNSLYFLEYFGIVASTVLGAGTALCGSVLVVKMALAITAPPSSGPSSGGTRRRRRQEEIFGAIYRAVLAVEATKASEVTELAEVTGREALAQPPAPVESDSIVHCVTTPAR